MTRSKLAILSLLPLAFGLGCEPTDNDCTGEWCDGVVDCGANCVDDPDDFEATVLAAAPDGLVVDFIVDGLVVHPNDTACEFRVEELGTYWLSFENEDGYVSIAKRVEITADDNGTVLDIQWTTGGCASDLDWEGATECTEWIPGEYGFPMHEGSYTDEVWGREVTISIAIDETIVIENVNGGRDATMSGYEFYGSTDVWWAGTIIDEETFSMTRLDAVDGSIDTFLFHRD